MSSVADHVLSALEAFRALSETLVFTDGSEDDDGIGLSRGISLPRVNDELARFKVWAGNIGAHRSGRSSLDYRLRDASHLRDQVVRLLEDISESLQDANSICRGERTPWDREPTQDSDELTASEPPGDTELSQIFADIVEVTDCLFRLSVSIRNPAPHDRFNKLTWASTSHYITHDTRHVQEAFPHAPAALCERLGMAVSRRRQYFAYRQKHHEKLARGLEENEEDAGAESTVASSIPRPMKMIVGEHNDLGVLDEDMTSEAGWTDTTYGSSMVTGDKPRVPPLPKDAHERPFECPFCYMMVSATTTRAWTKHVLADLRPYICLAPDCRTPREDYQSRHEWMQHAKKTHWRLWNCALRCGETFDSQTDLRAHVVASHTDVSEHSQLETLVNMSEVPKPLNTAQQCPLCHDSISTIKQYARHVGRHQKELALFALPRFDDGDVDTDAEQEQDSVKSNTSSELSEPNTAQKEELFRCPRSSSGCGPELRFTLHDLRNHLALHHPVDHLVEEVDETGRKLSINTQIQDSEDWRAGMASPDGYPNDVHQLSQVDETTPLEQSPQDVDPDISYSLLAHNQLSQFGEGLQQLQQLQQQQKERQTASMRMALMRDTSPDGPMGTTDPAQDAPSVNPLDIMKPTTGAETAWKTSQEITRLEQHPPELEQNMNDELVDMEYERYNSGYDFSQPGSDEDYPTPPAVSSTPYDTALTQHTQSPSPRTDAGEYGGVASEGTIQPSPQTFPCNECHRVFDQIHKLNHHKRYHDRPHECVHPGCGMKFGTKTHHDRHMNDKHNKPKRFYCTQAECPYSKKGGKSFPRKDNWRRHMVNKHRITPSYEPEAVLVVDGMEVDWEPQGQADTIMGGGT
ncbi:hypothetical protein B0H67DRAFT_109181 [Lasiosphaeris hirsuta]|uniref:C2H2-type domain-containing protein n=1 Tax=Lasiosphaeris hirsuta TaxID=260670 RepID=A0AA40AZ35_9PEZI|nr:hypothetical protein B0H67DRAFT_109181 [Lasiosphaeris hirsuta]